MKHPLRFIIVPKVAHPWYDDVHRGARAQAALLSQQLGVEVTVEFMPPPRADVTAQNETLEKAAASRPAGIAVDPLDTLNHMTAINRIREHGIPVVLFDAPSPEPGITSIGNNFTQQGVIAAERLVSLLGGAGTVAVMQGYPTAPNHKERYDAQVAVLKKHSGITIIDGGTDNDDIATAESEAAAVLAAHPDLDGYLCCDASGPIGIANAIRKAGRTGQVKVVSMDGIKPILLAVKEGVIDSSSATRPAMQGSMSILMLWQASLRMPMPQSIDTGIEVITRETVDALLAATDEAH
jgi:ribose transport system substrate-binding protein